MIGASGLCVRSSAVTAASFSSLMLSVRLRKMEAAYSTWSLKNWPKFFMYSLHFAALTTVISAPISRGTSSPVCSTAWITWDSSPTPVGSMMIRSGA